MGKHVGTQTVVFVRPPVIVSGASVVGPKEGQGPLASYFDEIWKDEMDGEKSWEKAESKLMKRAITLAIEKAGLKEENIQYILAGDLLNQLTASHFAIRDFSIPFWGCTEHAPPWDSPWRLAPCCLTEDLPIMWRSPPPAISVRRKNNSECR